MSLLLALLSPLGAQELVISEFMAANDRTLADEDDEFPDWIELYNPGPLPANLGGWSLSDDAVLRVTSFGTFMHGTPSSYTTALTSER